VLCIEVIAKNPTLTKYSESKVTPELAQDISQVKLQPQITMATDFDDIYKWGVFMKAPIGSVYEGGIFHIVCEMPIDYPFKPPKFSFATKIYLPFADPSGALCTCSCGGWPEPDPRVLVKDYLKVLWFVMKDPAAYLSRFCNLSNGIAKQLKDNYEAFAITAREWTKKYACQ